VCSRSRRKDPLAVACVGNQLRVGDSGKAGDGSLGECWEKGSWGLQLLHPTSSLKSVDAPVHDAIQLSLAVPHRIYNPAAANFGNPFLPCPLHCRWWISRVFIFPSQKESKNSFHLFQKLMNFFFFFKSPKIYTSLFQTITFVLSFWLTFKKCLINFMYLRRWRGRFNKLISL
jgi:hypothetical protein